MPSDRVNVHSSVVPDNTSVIVLVVVPSDRFVAYKVEIGIAASPK